MIIIHLTLFYLLTLLYPMADNWQLAVGVCWHILAYHFQFVLLHLTSSLLFLHWYNHNVTLRASFASYLAFLNSHSMPIFPFPPKVFPLHFFTALSSNRSLCTLPQDPARPRNVPDPSTYHHICPSLLYYLTIIRASLFLL